MRKPLEGGWKEWLLLISAAILFLTVLVFPLIFAFSEPLSAEEKQLEEAFLNHEIIRLHIIAHSDSPKDQAIKLAVRDAVLKKFGTLLAESSVTSEEAYQALLLCVNDMQETAKHCARELGFYGEIAAEAGVLWLPKKEYGQVILPAGEYRALRITLGKGEGQNWWCVLYPQLCLALAGETQPSANTGKEWNTLCILRNWLLFDK